MTPELEGLLFVIVGAVLAFLWAWRPSPGPKAIAGRVTPEALLRKLPRGER